MRKRVQDNSSVAGAKVVRRRGRVKEDGPNPVDVHVGQRVRLRRTIMGMSQEKLGDAVGLTFQQIQKYERGTNRISASKLFEFGEALNVPVSFFYDDMPDSVREAALAGKTLQVADGDAQDVPTTVSRDTLELMREIHAMDPSVRGPLVKLVRAMAVCAMKDAIPEALAA
ncbi:MAG: helix-turn-helix domain-containing protein [Alphaproteobacteria bacterium]